MRCNSFNINKIHVMHWNCQGITTNSAIAQIENFVRQNQIDIILLNETFLKPYHKFKIGGYTIYRRDRRSHGGGVLIGIRESIDHSIMPYDKLAVTESLSISVSINGNPIIITSAYTPHYNYKFREDLDTLTNRNNEYFIFGDFNAQHTSWNCPSNNSAGNVLYRYQNQSNFYVYHPPNPTRFSQNFLPTSPSTVDILLSNSSLSISDLETHPGILSSDHVPVTFRVYGSVDCMSHSFPLYHLADWVGIRSWVDNELMTQNITDVDADSSLDKVTNIIKGAIEQVPHGETKSYIRQISETSLSLIRQRKTIQRRYQRCFDSNRRITYQSMIKQISRLIDFHLDNDRNVAWSKFISNLPPGSKKFWKMSKIIKGKHTSIPSLKVNGVEVSSSENKADTIADVFERAHNITLHNHSSMDSKVSQVVRNVECANVGRLNSESLTSALELAEICSNLKNNKAPGIDNIHNTVLKNMSPSFFEALAKIFNSFITKGIFPNIFKRAKVIPIPKNGKDPKLPNSYRPISLLSALAKLFERVIYNRITTHTENNDIIHCKQFGFRKDHSTVHQIKRVIHIVEQNKAARRSTGVVLLDIEKAFDSIWHDGVIFKLNQLEFPLYLQKLIQNFLKNRTFFVCIGNSTSTLRNIPAGLPQGSVLSPILYSIYTSDITIKRNHDAAFYADDSAILCSGKLSNAIVKQLAASLKHIEKYFNKWKIKINREKTQAIIFPFNKSPKRVPNIPLQIQGNSIEIKKSIKYLGIILDSKLTFKEHVHQVCEKAIRCGRALFPLLNRKSKLNLKNKLLLYNMCIRPIMTYGCQAWYRKTAACHIKKLQVIQNKNLKIIHKLRWRHSTHHLHSHYGHNTINMVMRLLTLSFDERCRRSNYDIIRNLL